MLSSARYQGEPCKHGHSGIRYRTSRNCVVCAAAKSTKYYNSEAGKAYSGARHRKNTYGIDEAAFADLLAQQGAQCAICARPFIPGAAISTPHIDHCHTTGRVRGLLCINCNTGIGSMKDSTELLQRAITYLKEI